MQQVTVIAETSVALKPLIESAVRSELRMLEMGLERTRQRLRDFEAQFGLSSAEFARRYEDGDLSESLDFILTVRSFSRQFSRFGLCRCPERGVTCCKPTGDAVPAVILGCGEVLDSQKQEVVHV